MNYRSTQTARWDLHEVAATQGGYFTAKQAATIGYWQKLGKRDDTTVLEITYRSCPSSDADSDLHKCRPV